MYGDKFDVRFEQGRETFERLSRPPEIAKRSEGQAPTHILAGAAAHFRKNLISARICKHSGAYGNTLEIWSKKEGLCRSVVCPMQ